MAEKKPTYKQEAAAQEYMRNGGDRSAAYRTVYRCDKMKPNVINVKASELFSNGIVAVRVQELQKQAEKIAKEKFGVTSEEILRHLNILRTSRIDEYVKFVHEKVDTGQINENGDTIYIEVPRAVFKPFEELTEEQLMCIESIKVNRYKEVELKLHGKEWTIDKINKHIGFYEKDNKQKNSIDPMAIEDRNSRITELMEKMSKEKKL